jgi:surface polysaccharide O-acyltransferase-like enzyme
MEPLQLAYRAYEMTSAVKNPNEALNFDNRQSWIDILRGTSILLVMLSHSYGFTAFDKNLNQNALIDVVSAVNTSVEAFRMEIMFLLSGFLVKKGLKKGKRQYLTGKLHNIVYPFLVWSTIIFLLKQAGAVTFKGEPIEWEYLLRFLIGSTDLTWFLHELLLFYLITPLLSRVNVLSVIFASCAISSLIPRDIHDNLPGFNNTFINDLFYYYTYFFLGNYITRSNLSLSAMKDTKVQLISLAAISIILATSHFTDIAKTWPGYLPLVLASLPILFLASIAASRSPFSSPLKYLGENSIVFYLVHYPTQMVLTYLLGKVISDKTLLFLLLLLFGLLVPTIVSIGRTKDSFRFLNIFFSSQKHFLPAIRKSAQASPVS